jgi:cytoskeletal protein CcmA (bactofilin family)
VPESDLCLASGFQASGKSANIHRSSGAIGEIPDLIHERRSWISRSWIGVMRGEEGEHMFGKSNGQLLDEQLGVTPSRDTKPDGAVAQPQQSAVAQPRATPATRETRETSETISTLGPGMSIVGKIDCQGTLHIFGRIEGELRATNVLIGNGAQFDGNVIAQGVTIDGRLTGSIHATRVSLQSNAVVDGDIFHRVLSIDEKAQFEGSSRRVDNPTESATSSLKLDWSKAEPIRTEEKRPW